MIENIPFALVIYSTLLTVLAGLLFLLAFRKGHHRAQKRAHAFALLLLGYLTFHATLSLNRWFMDKANGHLHLLFPILFPTLLLAVIVFTPRGKRFVLSLNSNLLFTIQLLRIPLAALVYILATWKQAPWQITFFGWNFDLVYGIFTLMLLPTWRKKKHSKIFIFWNALGGILIVYQMVLWWLSAQSKVQVIGLNQPNFSATHFPFEWNLSILFPLFLAAHAILLVQATTKHELPKL